MSAIVFKPQYVNQTTDIFMWKLQQRGHAIVSNP